MERRATKSAWAILLCVVCVALVGLVERSTNAETAGRVVEIEFAPIEADESDDTRTLRSLRRVADDVYSITYVGDYRARLEDLNDQIIEHGIMHVIEGGSGRSDCSIFAAAGDAARPIFGRNLDNYTRRAILVGKFEPPDGYSSIAMMNLADMGFGPDDDLMQFAIEDRAKLLNCVLFVTDGMNEKGVAVALASIDPQRVVRDETKRLVNLSYLQREILDFAATLDEAIEIIVSRDVVDMDNHTLSHHLLIADASGQSAVAEYRGGQWRILRPDRPWQIATNTLLFDVSESLVRLLCERYRVADDYLEGVDGVATWQMGMEILDLMSEERTQWSSIYDLASRSLYLATHRDDSTILTTLLR